MYRKKEFTEEFVRWDKWLVGTHRKIKIKKISNHIRFR